MRSATSAKPWWGLIIGLLLLALWVARPLGVHAPQSLETVFDTDRAIARLAAILGDQRPHPTDSPANDAVRERLLGQIRQLGFVPVESERFHCSTVRDGAALCARPRNIAFWITAPGDDAVMLTAHYDSVPAGPGAADDGIGVAVALEVAHLLKGRKLARPTLVLLTDAEEAGLVGAAAFAAHDPLAKRIGAVVNVEARGTTGGVNMFQTGRPNARDVAALPAVGRLPAASSLSTDFYELLPNDTDLTVLLPLGVDAGNYSIIGGGKRYHTPLDNLDHLDTASVRQMGASTLSAVTRFAGVRSGKGAEGQRIFTDLGGRLLLAMSQGAALAWLLLGLAGAAVLFARSDRVGRVKAALTPPVAIIVGTCLAVGAAWLVAALRADAAYGTAYPAALRLMYGAAALTGAALTLHVMRTENRMAVAAATWIWLGALILAAFAFVPGLSILAIWSLMFVVAASLASFLPSLRRAVPVLLLAAALLFLLIVLPIAGGLEEGLFIENAAPAGALLIFAFLFFMPGRGARSRLIAIVFAVVLAGAFLAALLVPAYAPDAPRHLSVIHEDAEGEAAFVIADNGPLPSAMKAAASFAAEPDERGNWRAPAPRLANDGSIATRIGAVQNGMRTVQLVAEAPNADRQEILIEDGEAIRRVRVNGTQPGIKGVPAYIGCSGRACRQLSVEILLDAAGPAPEILWRRTTYGPGEAAARLAGKRPDTAQPVHLGDRRVIVRPVPFGASPTAAQ